MKLYSVYSSSHLIFKNEWFAPNLHDEYEIELVEEPQLCLSGEYSAVDFLKFNIKQAELMIRAVKENWGDCFVYADIDIQFFKPSIEQLLRLLKNKDMVVQQDTPSGVLCAGFLCSRANDKTLALWEDIRECMFHELPYHNQALLNFFMLDNVSKQTILKTSKIKNLNHLSYVNPHWLRRKIKTHFPNRYKLKWDYLPVTFFGGGTLTGKCWNPGDSLLVPEGIVLHHANWTVGVERKISQLKYVRDIVENRKRDQT